MSAQEQGHRPYPSRLRAILITVLFLVIVIGIALVSRFESSSVSQTTQTSETAIAFTASNPIILNGRANVTYPASYGLLANYSLGLINKDRTANGLSILRLSNVGSAQQHADSEMYFGYFGHWDTQGYKPYMRYTLLGGSGAVSENVALNACQDSTHTFIERCTIETIENAINASEWEMMNNDTICCDNGHRLDILDSFHNRVAIGIAWNSTSSNVYFVEDFENSYFVTSTFSYASSVVTIETSQSMPLYFNPNKGVFAVYYEPLPKPLRVGFNMTHAELRPDCLSNGATSCSGDSTCGMVKEAMETKPCEYWGGYDAGQLVGFVFAPCPSGYYCEDVTMGGVRAFYADRLQSSGKQLLGSISLAEPITAYGKGVYTLYLYDSLDNNWLTLSIFVNP